jgi:hypothetical protein
MTGHNRIPTVSPAAWWKFWRDDSGTAGLCVFIAVCALSVAAVLYVLEQWK